VAFHRRCRAASSNHLQVGAQSFDQLLHRLPIRIGGVILTRESGADSCCHARLPFLDEERIGTRAGVGKGSEAWEGSQRRHFVQDAGAGAVVR
jgi:hypothetical protein